MERESELFVFVPLPWICMNLYSKFTPFSFFFSIACFNIIFSSFLVIFFESLCCRSGILFIDSRTI